MRRSFRPVFLLAGVVLFGWLIHRVGLAEIAAGIRSIGWGMLAVILLAGVSHVIKTLAWRATLPPEVRPPTLWMLAVRIIGESVSMLTFAGQAVGETTRAMLLKQMLPVTQGVSSVILDRSIFILTGCLFMASALLALPFEVALPSDSRISMAAAAGVIVLILVTVARALRKGWPFLSGPVRWASRLVGKGGGRSPRLVEIEETIQGFVLRQPRRFAIAVGLNLVGHCLSVVEVFLILRLVGVEATWVHAFLIEGLTKIVNIMGFLIPGNMGTYEGGNMLILELLELGGGHGLTLGIARRLRGLAWTAVGILISARIGGFSAQEDERR